MSGDTAAAAAVVGLQAAASIDRYAIRSPDPEQQEFDEYSKLFVRPSGCLFFCIVCLRSKRACMRVTII